MPTTRILSAVRMIRDACGQDVIEYALIAGFLAAFACVVLPGAADVVGATAQKVSGTLVCAASADCPISTEVTP